jgi:hypothetical protein
MIAAALTVAVSGTAAAQSTPPPPAQTPTAAVLSGPTRSHWTAAGFVGSNFSTKTDIVDTNDDNNASFGFGGQLGYLWGGTIGIEGLADITPSLDVSSALFVDEPSVSSYMANVIGALPLGAEGQIQPYVSGGFGQIRMSADVLNLVTVQPVDTTDDLGSTSTSESRFGTNFGGGLMAFAGHFGFRTDIRFYRASSDDAPLEDTSAGTFTRQVLSGLDFWRANLGLALRW